MHGRSFQFRGGPMGAIIVSLVISIIAPHAAEQCQYEVTVIEGPQRAFGQASMYSSNLNEQGQVVGDFHNTAGWDRPFL